VGVDRVQPQQLDEGILFIQGDVANVKELLPPDILLTFHRPWLMIEDAHVNVFDVIHYMASVLRPKDYLIIEDSIAKQEVVLAGLGETEGHFAVDTYYTDFFGINATSAVNTILTQRG
jgi:hypothetical protein